MSGWESFLMAEEFADVDFNEARLEKRFVRTMETLSRQPGGSIRASGGNRAEAKTIYNMLGNENHTFLQTAKAAVSLSYTVTQTEGSTCFAR